ncbi:penicillin-binding protein 1C [Dongia deserti]|uniref:penicillin-binding protein 1C n=1 Tax=Dongia deserti TaxID=2268030 RepID=UPI0013C43F87|nr:penicillin-binding protein 1C [Dongia deserti]
MTSWRWFALALGCVLLTGVIGDRVLPLDFARFDRLSTVAVDRRGETLRIFLATDGVWRLPAHAGEVDPLYLDMLLAYEDQRFKRHPGVDPLAVGRALLQWAGNGRIVSGASTITMQTARLLEPRPRTMRAKLIEMARALQLEVHHSKLEILDVYLTLAPFGGNLEGIRAASRAYFDKEPRRLTEAEAALLVALPRAPEQLRPDRDPVAAEDARNRVLDIAAERGVIDRKTAEEAKRAPVPRQRHPLPFLAPHLTERLARQSDPGQHLLHTTIDATMQSAVEELLQPRLRDFPAEVGMAAMVVENSTLQVVAYVGAPDYFDEERRGMIDMATAVRSPGSTLKPFIYGIGFDRLLLHPDTLMSDSPRDFDGYVPANFDDGFHGDVTAREALQHSLNIPAVALLNRIGSLSFDAALQQVGVTARFDRSRGGASLPFALGGLGLTLEELVTLYAAIPNGGQVRALSSAPDQTPSTPSTLFGPVAAWYVARALEGVSAPRGYADDAGQTRSIGFKTGTSYGYRDAWALGFSGDYTIGVWVGRPDGTPCDACIGMKAAAPILFRVAELLPASPPLRAAPPAGIISGPTGELPPGLRRFERPIGGVIAPKRDPNALSITFPVDGSRLKAKKSPNGLAPIALRAAGGAGRLIWFVNGKPLADPTQRWNGEWYPDGGGFTTIEAMDSEGRSTRIEVFLDVGR